MEDELLARTDAAVLAEIIHDNDHWNTLGISEDDVAVCFEMSPVCQWGSGFSAARYKRALDALRDLPDVARRGHRWFTQPSRALDRVDKRGEVVCARVGCGKKLALGPPDPGDDPDAPRQRSDAIFCSDRCRVMASRKGHQRSK